MRIVMVWITAFSLLFIITLGWYVTLPVIIGVSRNLNATTSDNPNVANISTAIEYAAYAWGPIMMLFIVLWAIISSQKRDVESEVHG